MLTDDAQADHGWTTPARDRGAVAFVDLDALAHNVRRVRQAAPTAEVMAVVKADAYGHGLVPCARAVQEAGATWLATALVEEALALRRAGVAGPVLALLCPGGAGLAAAVRSDIDVSVSGSGQLAAVVAAARAAGQSARVHLEVDTGLSRGGVPPAELAGLLAATATAVAERSVVLAGIWSHFACADTPGHPATARALERYAQALTLARRAGLRPEVRHLANSAAALTLPASHYDVVRSGIALYGLSPGAQLGSATALGLRAAMSLRARLALVKAVPAGEGVSYGHEYVTTSRTVLALVPLGYGDGVPRSASGVGPVQLPGSRRTIAGRVCMDQFVLDLGPDSPARAGDVVTLFGDGSRGEPTADEWGAAAGTIGYEIVTRLSARVPRVHVRGGS